MKPFTQINPARLTGKKYWRSLDEAAAAPEFQERLLALEARARDD